MRIAVGGSSGLIGSALVDRLMREGHDVVRLVRRTVRNVHERQWGPNGISGLRLRDCDAVINLAGAGIAERPWTGRYRAALIDSRISTTRAVVRALDESQRCTTFLSGSAIGIYGTDRGERILTEDESPGGGFLASLCQRWEDAAADADARVVFLRTGHVLSKDGGYIGKQKPLFQLGLGGPTGNGQQYVSWISRRDHVAAMIHLLTSQLAGPVNVVGPHPVTNAEFVQTWAGVLHRPAKMSFPTSAASLVFGRDMVRETIQAGQRVVPQALLDDGFVFADADLAQTLRHLS